MPHVSQRKLDPKVEENIKKLLIKLISDLKTQDNLEDFLGAFLSETERVMLAKRFLAIYLLEKENKIQEIADVLNLSEATVVKLNLKRQLDRENFLLAFKKMDRVFLKGTVKDIARVVGREIATHIARGGRFKLPRNS